MKSQWLTGSRQSRGYGADWQRVRKIVLERDGHLCQCKHCKTEGRTSIATEVDHIVSRANAKAMGWSKERTEHLAAAATRIETGRTGNVILLSP